MVLKPISPCIHGTVPELCPICKAIKEATTPKSSGPQYVLKVRVRNRMTGGFGAWTTARVFASQEEAVQYLEQYPMEPHRREMGIWFKGKRIR